LSWIGTWRNQYGSIVGITGASCHDTFTRLD